MALAKKTSSASILYYLDAQSLPDNRIATLEMYDVIATAYKQ